MANIVIDLNDRRPAWALPDWVAQEVAAAAPAGWSVHVAKSLAEGTGDGQAGTAPEVLSAVRDATVYIGFGVTDEVLCAGQNLKWVHSGSAGVGHSLSAEMLRRDILFTNSAGVHGPPMADAILGMLLYFFRGFDLAVRAARERRWSADRFYSGDYAFPELASSRVGILGLGGIGVQLAKRLHALGAQVVGLKRTAGRPVDLPAAVDVRVGLGELQGVLKDCDAIVITLPNTAETKRLVDAAALRTMRAGAVLINVSRGALVDETALVAALQRGHLRGAGLDVFQREPLAADHPLWDCPNVLITPHVTPLSAHYWRRETDLILGNLRRLLAGEPLTNLVDKQAGY